MATPQESKRIDELVMFEHQQIRHLAQEYSKAPTAEVKQNLANHMIRIVSMHAAKEEESLYPTLGRVFGPERLSEDMHIKQLLLALDNSSAYKDEQGYDRKMRELCDFMLPHNDQEEVEMPALLKADNVDPYELGRKFELAGRVALTRPHTWGPTRPPWSTIAKMVMGPLDRAADFVRFAGYVPDVPALPRPSRAA